MQSTLLCTCYRLPSGIDPRATREICGEYKEMDGILCLRGRGNLNIILQAKIREGVGNSKVCTSTKALGVLSAESHLTQGTLSCKISRLLGKLFKFARGSTLLGRQ